MIGETIKSVLEFLKLSPRYFFFVASVTAVPLFASESILERIGLMQLAKDYRQWFGCIFVVAIGLLAVNGSAEVIRWKRDATKVEKLRKRRLQRLHALTEHEKQILRFYIAEQTRTSVLSVMDGVVKGLEAAGIITRVTTISTTASFDFGYNISEWAWEYLNQHEELLMGETNIMRSRTPDQETYNGF